LQRTRARANGKCRIGSIRTGPRVLRGPLRISHELGAEAIVIGDRLLDQRPGLDLALRKQRGDFGDGARERVGHGVFLIGQQ
jgi:hypothetical protein